MMELSLARQGSVKFWKRWLFLFPSFNSKLSWNGLTPMGAKWFVKRNLKVTPRSRGTRHSLLLNRAWWVVMEYANIACCLSALFWWIVVASYTFQTSLVFLSNLSWVVGSIAYVMSAHATNAVIADYGYKASFHPRRMCFALCIKYYILLWCLITSTDWWYHVCHGWSGHDLEQCWSEAAQPEIRKQHA